MELMADEQERISLELSKAAYILFCTVCRRATASQAKRRKKKNTRTRLINFSARTHALVAGVGRLLAFGPLPRVSSNGPPSLSGQTIAVLNLRGWLRITSACSAHVRPLAQSPVGL